MCRNCLEQTIAGRSLTLRSARSGALLTSLVTPLTVMSLGVLKTAAHNAGRRTALRLQVGFQGTSYPCSQLRI